MDEQTKREITEIIQESLRSVEDEIPMAQRNEVIRWAKVQMERQRKRDEMFERVRGSVLGWVVVGVLGTVGVAVYQYVLSLIHNSK